MRAMDEVGDAATPPGSGAGALAIHSKRAIHDEVRHRLDEHVQ